MDPLVTPENIAMLKTWVEAVIRHSWMLPPKEAAAFLDSELTKLAKEYGVELSWHEVRTVEITYPDEPEVVTSAKRHLRLVP